MHRIDSATATSDHKFTEGDPTIPIAATTVTADWLNAVQEEIAAVITGASEELDKADNAQLFAAILTLASGRVGARSVLAGPGLTGGGSLATDVTLSTDITWSATAKYDKPIIIMRNGDAYAWLQASGPGTAAGAKDPAVAGSEAYWKRLGGSGGPMPSGAVVPFYNVTLGGTEGRNPIFWGQSEPDTGWLICDGGSDGQGGTVLDLRGKFIMGATGTDDAGETGGADSVTPTVTVAGSSSQISVSATTLNVNQMPSHGHSLQAGNRYDVSPRNQISATDANITQTLNVVNAAGGSQAHTHGVTDSTHTHTATSSTVATLPPFYKLIYCVKLPAA